MGSRLTSCGDGSSGDKFRPGHNAFRNWPEEEKKVHDLVLSVVSLGYFSIPRL